MPNISAHIIYAGVTLSDEAINSLTWNETAQELTAATSFGNSFTVELTGVGGSTVLPLNKILFVAENGNDTSAVKGDITKPFRNPWAAVKAALTDEAVIILPGAYTNANAVTPLTIANNALVKNGVTVYAYKGVKINYTSTGSTVTPFYDNGNPLVSKFLGEADIVIVTTTSTDSGIYLTHPDSDLEIVADTMQERWRVRCTAMKRLVLKYRRHVVDYPQCLSIRLSSPLDAILIHEVEEIDFTFTTLALSHSGIRNFGPNGYIRLKYGNLKVYNPFFSTGTMYFQQIRCKIEGSITYDYAGGAAYEQVNKHIFVSTFDEADWDMTFNLKNWPGMGLRWTNRSASPTGISQGQITIRGRVNTPDFPTSTFRNTLAGLPSDSRLKINLDVDVTNNIAHGNLLNAIFMDCSNSPVACRVSGRLRHIHTVDNERPPFRLDSGTTAPVFEDLSVETSSDYFCNGTATSVVDVPVKNVACNKPLEPTFFTDVIEPLKVYTDLKA